MYALARRLAASAAKRRRMKAASAKASRKTRRTRRRVAALAKVVGPFHLTCKISGEFGKATFGVGKFVVPENGFHDVYEGNRTVQKLQRQWPQSKKQKSRNVRVRQLP